MGTFLRGAGQAFRRTFFGPDYPPIQLRLRSPRIAAVAPGLGLLLLLVLVIVTAEYLRGSRYLPTPSAWLLALLSVVPLAALLPRPLLAWRLLLVGELFGTFNVDSGDAVPWSPVQVLVMILVLLVVAARVDRPVLAWIGFFSFVPILIFVPQPDQAGVTLLFMVVLVIGTLVRRNLVTRQALAEQSEVSDLEKARRTVLEERTRIAREMHDVVAHHMSMIAVQAETAPYRLGDLSEPVREEFATIAGAAREALTDMRRLLGVLRSEAAEPLKAPQPGLADVPELVAATLRAGVPAELDVAEGAEPPEAVGLAAYRIVQEALANASRHAPGAAVRVEIRPWTSDLSLRIHNGPATQPAADAEPGEGHGLAGMRERVGLLGGELTAGPTADGGFAVAARLPYDDNETP
ncbi:sensor histidine kinase [Phytohabitans rumicis]|uniref:sensor histidine kinase n=1 Tax=Phytohabitans rumicis TaxID=1076125 RepID=UPI0031EA158A